MKYELKYEDTVIIFIFYDIKLLFERLFLINYFQRDIIINLKKKIKIYFYL